MKTKDILLLLAISMGSICSQAQDPIAEAISIIVDNSPALQEQRALIKAQQADEADANALSNPEVNFARVWGRHGIGNKLQLDISQSFSWPGVYRLRSRAAAEGITSAELMIESAALDISLEAKQKLVELVYVRKHLDLTHELYDNIMQMRRALDSAVDRGELTVLDQRKLHVEVYKRESELAALECQEREIEGALRSMCPGVELPLDGIVYYPVEPLLTQEQYEAQVVELDPLLMAQKSTVEAEALNAKVASQSRMPGFSVGYQHQAEMGDRFNGFTIGMSLPFFENRHARQAAASRQAAAQYVLEQSLAAKKAEVGTQLAEMRVWKGQIDLYNTMFGDNTYLPLLFRAYEGGEMTVLEYLAEVQYYHDVTLQYLEAQYNYAMALAILNRYSLLR